MTSPDDTTATPSPAEQLVAIARQIRDWQDASRPKLSNEAMIRRFPGLGSTKTYRRLIEGDTTSLVIEQQLAKYSATLAQIVTESAAVTEEIYDDIAPAIETGLAVATAMQQRGKTRLVLIEGPTGSGKSTALGLLAARYPGAAVLCEAHEGWTSLNAALGDLCRAIGTRAEDVPPSVSLRLAHIIERLGRQRRCLLIDEAHHCTAAVLNAVKTIINLTDSVIVLAGIDTLWRKLTARSWEEARQLIHNRLHERVRMPAPTTEDVAVFLCRRVPGLDKKALGNAPARIAAMAEGLGSWAFLRRLAEHLASPAGDLEPAEIIAAALRLKAVLETR
jgi:hypothetical protein